MVVLTTTSSSKSCLLSLFKMQIINNIKNRRLSIKKIKLRKKLQKTRGQKC